jgi:aerobic carbon-monoxide dehydrogenase small subunit
MRDTKNGDTVKKKVVKRVADTERTAGHHNINLVVNGKPYELLVGKDVNPEHTLAHTLRVTLGYTGTKISCDHGACGACTVLMDGKAVLSCMTLTIECDGRSVTTIEGLEDPKTGKLHPIQQAFVDHTAFQCGFCTPGIIMTTKALLDENPSPSGQEIKEALAGHYCRCISHYHVLDAVSDVIRKSEVK